MLRIYHDIVRNIVATFICSGKHSTAVCFHGYRHVAHNWKIRDIVDNCFSNKISDMNSTKNNILNRKFSMYILQSGTPLIPLYAFIFDGKFVQPLCDDKSTPYLENLTAWRLQQLSLLTRRYTETQAHFDIHTTRYVTLYKTFTPKISNTICDLIYITEVRYFAILQYSSVQNELR